MERDGFLNNDDNNHILPHYNHSHIASMSDKEFGGMCHDDMLLKQLTNIILGNDDLSLPKGMHNMKSN